MLIPDGEWFCPPCQHVSYMRAMSHTDTVSKDRLKRRPSDQRPQTPGVLAGPERINNSRDSCFIGDPRATAFYFPVTEFCCSLVVM